MADADNARKVESGGGGGRRSGRRRLSVCHMLFPTRRNLCSLGICDRPCRRTSFSRGDALAFPNLLACLRRSSSLDLMFDITQNLITEFSNGRKHMLFGMNERIVSLVLIFRSEFLVRISYSGAWCMRHAVRFE